MADLIHFAIGAGAGVFLVLSAYHRDGPTFVLAAGIAALNIATGIAIG